MMPSKPEKTDISCVILAGGEGRRFNREDKGLVLLDGKPLIEHVIEQVSSQVDDIVISANRNIDVYRKYTDRVIEDLDRGFNGPLAGIASCISACDHEWILVLPCDIPVLPADLVEILHEIDNNKLIIAKAGERRQLVFLMHRSLTGKLNDYLAQGHQKAMAWVELQNPAVVEFICESGEFVNINTPDKLTALKDEPNKD